ncbi:hypothetical protein N0B44_06295 [Roseibacterium beibuensis]|uniref:Uncharacterized protein n=1 Tax=[Roseibacterium] beibuensis TaxID=1193142 RepID=A0ABP9KTV5_9RHOB|nr:hypothetical protein [Roseibacterium beibuensis]
MDNDDPGTQIASDLAAGLRAPEVVALLSQSGFVVDTGSERQLSEVSGDIRIEASEDRLIVRADGLGTGREAQGACETADFALKLAGWFIASGGVGRDGRGRVVGALRTETRCRPARLQPWHPIRLHRHRSRARFRAGFLSRRPSANWAPPTSRHWQTLVVRCSASHPGAWSSFPGGGA